MRRGRLSREGSLSNNPRGSFACNVARGSVANAQRKRSSSVDHVNRGSYIANARCPSVERYRRTPSNSAKGVMNPRSSVGSLFAFQRGSTFERKTTKDTRPLNERKYQKECVFKLVQYLSEAKFPYSVNPENLLPPSRKDFLEIFQFLYSMWDPKIKIKCIEDEGPSLLKGIGYPYMVTKTSFQSIHSSGWPTLLGTLMWLMELNKMSASFDMNSYVAGVDGFQKDEAQCILVNYVVHSFHGSPEDPEMEEKVFANLIAQKYNMGVNAEEVEAQCAELEAALEKENEEKKMYASLCEENKQMEKDLDGYISYIKEMEEHMKKKEVQLLELQNIKTGKEKELQELMKKVTDKEAVYKVQGFDAQYAQNYYQVTKADLKEKLASKKETLKEEEKNSWDLEIQLFHVKEQMDTLCKQFGTMWDEFRESVDSTQVNRSNPANPIKLLKSNRQKLPEFKMFPNCINEVRDVLEKFQKSTEEQIAATQETITVKQNLICEIQSNISDLCINEQMFSTKLAQKQREEELLIKENQEEMETIQQECSALEQKLQSCLDERARNKHEIAMLKKKLNKLGLEKEKAQEKLADEEKAADFFKTNVKLLIQGAIKQVEAKRAEVEGQLGQVLQNMESP